MQLQGSHSIFGVVFMGALGFWNFVIPAAISALSGLFGGKSKEKQADATISVEQARCEGDNQRRAALGGAVASAYGIDPKSPQISALLAPRPCPKTAGGAGGGYGIVSDLLGGAALTANSLMNNPYGAQGGQPGAPGGPQGGMQGPGVPCPPPMISYKGSCVDPSSLFGGGDTSASSGGQG